MALKEIVKVTADQFDSIAKGVAVSNEEYDPDKLFLIADSIDGNNYTLLYSSSNTTSTGTYTYLTLSDFILNFDLIVFDVSIGSSSYHFTQMVPAVLFDAVYTSLNNSIRITGTSTSYYTRLYRYGTDQIAQYNTGANTYGIKIYGVKL